MILRALPVHRAALVAGIGALRPGPEIQSAAVAASRAASFTHSKDSINSAISAASASDFAASAAAHFEGSVNSSSAAENDAGWSAAYADNEDIGDLRQNPSFKATYISASRDASLIEDNLSDNVFQIPLWAVPEPEALEVARGTLNLFFEEAPEVWSFWKRWYEGMLKGQPLDWDLQEAVALIPDEDWEKGAAHIAEKIREIEFAHRTSVDRRAVFNEDTKRFELEPLSALPEDTLSFARKRINQALVNALKSGSTNGLTEESYETRVVRGAVDNHPEDGSLLAVSFFDACMSFERTIGDVYPRDTSLINLKNALFATCEEITDLDEAAKARVQRLVALGRPTIILDPDRAEVAKIPGYVEALTSEELDSRIREASDVIANSEKPPSSVRARLANWITTITIWMDRTMKGDKRLTWLVKQVERMRGWWDDVE